MNYCAEYEAMIKLNSGSAVICKVTTDIKLGMIFHMQSLWLSYNNITNINSIHKVIIVDICMNMVLFL